MSRDRGDYFDPSQPTLVVQFGNTKRKHRPLDRDVMILGRAAGCDVGLEAPDVAPVHCVIVRAADAWRVRDCTGRGGTRLNGQAIHDAVLSDEDVLQIGSFSFALHLPPDHLPLTDSRPVPADPALRRARRSRHNLARLALRLRERLAERAAAPEPERPDPEIAARQEDLDRQTEQLEALRRDVDARLADLKQTAQEVAARGAAVEERRREVEATARDQGIRARELAAYAAHLRRTRRRLDDHCVPPWAAPAAETVADMPSPLRNVCELRSEAAAMG